MRKSREFFICQQGFAVPNPNPHLYSALMLQPRIIAGVVTLGSMLQSYELFLLLAAVLAWATIVPRQNLFDAIRQAGGNVLRALDLDHPLDAALASGQHRDEFGIEGIDLLAQIGQ